MKTISISVDGGPVQVFQAVNSTVADKVTNPQPGDDGSDNVGVIATFNAHTTKDTRAYNQAYSPSVGGGVGYSVAIDIAPEDTTAGRYYAGMDFSDYGPERAFVDVSVSRLINDFGPGSVILAKNQNSASAVFNINDSSRAGFNLTTGRWYLNFRNAPNNSGAKVVIFSAPEVPA